MRFYHHKLMQLTTIILLVPDRLNETIDSMSIHLII